MRLNPGEILIGFMPNGEVQILDWDETVSDVAFDDGPRPDHVLAIDPTKSGASRNLDLWLEDAAAEMKHEAELARRHEKEVATR